MTQEAIAQYQDLTIRRLMEIRELWIPRNETIRSGIGIKQRSKHIYALADALDQLKKQQFDKSSTLPQALIWSVTEMEEERQWKASSSILNQAHTLYGALIRLDQYAMTEPVNMDNYSEWVDAMKTWTKSSLQHLPSVTEATWPAVSQTIASLPAIDAVTLLIAWLHAARVGNVYTIKLHELDFQPEQGQPNGMRFSVVWTRAKTVEKVGAYTTHSWISTPHYRLLRTWIQGRRRRGCEWLVPIAHKRRTMNKIRAGLRTINPRWDLRSLRRGALCTLARNDTPLDTVLTFSGHKNMPMLLRYLRHGLHAGLRSKKGAEAARQGFPDLSS
jgi:integrase